jgi:hypothetical protein
VTSLLLLIVAAGGNLIIFETRSRNGDGNRDARSRKSKARDSELPTKNFNVLGAQYFRHSISFHSSCFRAVAVITQLSFENGATPFQVDFRNEEE